MREANVESLKRLAALGSPVSEAVIVMNQVQTLLDFAVGPQVRLAYEAHVEMRLASLLEHFEKQVTGLQVASVIPPQGA